MASVLIPVQSFSRLSALSLTFFLFPMLAGAQGPTPNQPLPVTGKVLMEDGSVPPERVKVEMICSGAVIPYGFTDSKGQFGGRAGGQLGNEQDASVADPRMANTRMPAMGGVGSGVGRAGLGSGGTNTTCDIQASYPGYSTGVVSLASRRMDDQSLNVGVIVLHKLAKTEGATISLTTLKAPNDARKAFEKARQAAVRKKWDEASTQYEKAVRIYPAFAAAWFELGLVAQQQQDMARATAAYQKAIEADPKYVNPYAALSQLGFGGQKWADAARLSAEVIRLDPVDYPQCYLVNAVSNVYSSQFEQAEKSAAAGIKSDVAHRFPQLHQVLAAMLMRREDAAGALENLKIFLKYSPQAVDVEKVRQQVADLEKQVAAKR